jgi:hypothetical protein
MISLALNCLIRCPFYTFQRKKRPQLTMQAFDNLRREMLHIIWFHMYTDKFKNKNDLLIDLMLRRSISTMENVEQGLCLLQIVTIHIWKAARP